MVSGGEGGGTRGGDEGDGGGIGVRTTEGDGGGDDEQMTGQVPHSLMQSCPATAAGEPCGNGSVF